MSALSDQMNTIWNSPLYNSLDESKFTDEQKMIFEEGHDYGTDSMCSIGKKFEGELESVPYPEDPLKQAIWVMGCYQGEDDY